MRKTIAILLLLLPSALGAQNTHWEFSLGAEYMITRYSFTSPYNTFGSSIDVTWFNRMTGDECWKQQRHYPSIGIRFDLGITPQSICGNRLGAAPILRTPLLPWLDFDMGLGLAIYGKPASSTGDTANVFITTPVVCLLDLGLVLHHDDRSHLALRLLHSSNGNMHRPNRGLNFFHLEMGMNLGKEGRGRRTESGEWRTVDCEMDPWHEIGFTLSPSLTASRHSMQKGMYFCYDISLNYQYRRSTLWGYGATVDLWYNFSHVWQLDVYHDDYSFPMYVSAMPFLEFYWGRLSLRGGMGLTLISSDRVIVPVYERLCLYYNFGQSYAGVGINAHFGQAEFIEWSYGYRIPIRKRPYSH